MTLHADGSANCDRCGVDIGNAGVGSCVVFTGSTEDGRRIETFHLCLRGVPGGEGCANRILSKSALAWYVENVGEKGATPKWFVPGNAEEQND